MNNPEIKTPTAFFCSNSTALFDDTLLGGLDQMAQLLHADMLFAINRSMQNLTPHGERSDHTTE